MNRHDVERWLVATAVGLAAAAAPGAAPAAAQEAAAEREARAAPPGSAVRLGLEEAVRRAVTYGEDVLVARAEQARTEGQVKEVRARSLPEITADFGYTRNIQRPVIFFQQPDGTVQQISIGNDNDYSFGLTLNQSVLDFSLGPARRAARLTEDATEAQVEAARTGVALQAKVDYYTVLLDERLVRVREQALEQARARLEEVEMRFEAGTASEFEVLTARVEVDNLRPPLIEARNQLELDRNRLKRTVDLPLDAALVLTDSLLRPSEVGPVVPAAALETGDAAATAAVDEALGRRSDLRAQRVVVQLQQANLDAQQGQAWPTLDLMASLSRRASSAEFFPEERDFSQTATAGVALSLPLFDGQARSGRVQQARASVDRERFRLDRLAEDIRLDVQQAVQNLRAARERVEASEATVARAERALEIAQTRFRSGLSTQLELDDAELAVTEARTNFARALFDFSTARARLQAALGER